MSRASLFLLFYLFLLSCSEPPGTEAQNVSPAKPHNTGELIPIDLADTNYIMFRGTSYDTTTASGWTISHLVKNDSTRYNDLYIKWSKGDSFGILKDEFSRPCDIPHYSGENATHFFLVKSCFSSGIQVLVLSKDSFIADRFDDVIAYDPATGRIAMAGGDEVRIKDLTTRKYQSVKIGGLCRYPHVDNCTQIDSLLFEYPGVKIFTTKVIDFKKGTGTKKSYIVNFLPPGAGEQL